MSVIVIVLLLLLISSNRYLSYLSCSTNLRFLICIFAIHFCHVHLFSTIQCFTTSHEDRCLVMEYLAQLFAIILLGYCIDYNMCNLHNQ